MDREELLHCFQFKDQTIFENEVQSVAALQFHVLVDHRHRLLTLEVEASQGQLTRKTFFIRRLEQTRTEQAMYLDGCTDDLVSKLVVGHVSYRGNEL